MSEGLIQPLRGAGGEGRSYLAPFYDPGLAIPRGLEISTIVAEECERISTALAVVLYASTLPRRLGGDAEDSELASDKKYARRVAHALRGAYRGWDKKSPTLPSGDEIRQEGAQLLWSNWHPAHIRSVESRAVLAVTFALRSNEDRWGKTALTNYLNEISWINYSMRG